jgi:peptidoglycan/LPS O-acetylase OafA/YrhL
MLRGVAALMVFVFHLCVTLDRYSAFKLRPYVHNLTLGVDLFFPITAPAESASTACFAGSDR